ncbi:MAG: class I SAM-dependent methyltransferase [Sedimentisphaerales bacterium]|nr:class I SAM-dependent methyltransferase [Sedimentisphaerales bacterium]
MSRRITLWILVTVMLAGMLVAQERGGARGRAVRGGAMRGDMQTWLGDLEAAYNQNDRDKMGQLIADMKQRSQRMRPGMGGPGMGGPGMGGPGMGGPGMGGQMRGDGDSFFNNKLMSKDDNEKKILAVLDDLDRNQRRGMMNVPVLDGRLLRLLTEAVGAKYVVELGTSNGYSGIWFGLALQKTGGKLTTHEIDATRASLARENFKKAGVEDVITLVEGDGHENVKKIKEPIDILFLDADKDGYIDYLNTLLPLVRPGGLIVGHNINEQQADPKYIEAITKNPALESLLVHGQVSVTLKKR